MKPIEMLLRQRIGLDGTVAGPTTLERIIRRRMKALGLTRIDEYYRCLMGSSKEYEELVEAVVVKETWFFRDTEAFDGLVRMVLEGWLPRHPTGKMRVLSLPCSSGEEAFSIVMALLDAGVPPDRFVVDAMDLSRRAVSCAEQGVYGKHAFRAKDLRFRDRYFHLAGEQFVLNPQVRQLVHFAQGNLLNPEFATAHAGYDFIFFRNLLIYLGLEAQSRALRKIDELLSPGGALFVGSAELPILLDWGFVSAGVPMSFACLKRSTRQQRPVHFASQPERSRGEGVGRSGLDPASLRRSCSDLGQARRLADAGRLAEAAEICETHLRHSQYSAQAYYLLGLVREARGDPRAMECYRKALYLEPNHHETLLQLAMLAEHKGDVESARNFHRRAQRLERGNTSES